MRFYLQREGSSYGPYSEDELKQHVASGNIGAGEWLFPEEGGAAVPVSQIVPITPAVTQNARPVKKRSLLWLWITLGVVGGLMLLCGGVAAFFLPHMIKFSDMADVPLLEDRKGHQTVWNDAKSKASGELPEPPGEVFQLVRYPSPAGELGAYLTPDPKDGQKHPAVVWAKGGFGGIGDFLWETASHRNDQSARAFREAGLVLMCPSWRGENDNPGRFEFFYGEVEDFIAAIEYVKKLPYVDPERVYIGGHSTGGTLTLLAAAAGADYRAAFSFGGAPDMVELMEDGDAYGKLPYDVASTRDHELRSAIRYVAFIEHPTFYFEGATSTEYLEHAEHMQMLAGQKDTPFEAFSLKGDHFNILAPITQLVARKIQADTGPTCAISFTKAELAAAQTAMADRFSLAKVLAEWVGAKTPPDLEQRLEALGEDAIPATKEDIAALRMAVEAAARGHDLAAAKSLAALSLTGEEIAEKDVADLFRTDVVPSLRGWISEIAESAELPSEEMLEPVFDVLYMIAWQDDEAGGRLLAQLIRDGFAPGGDWSNVFDAMDPTADAYVEIMDTLRPGPPAGALGEMLAYTVNQALVNEEWDGKHPYDSPAGGQVLKAWLEAPEYEPAFNAALALAFVEPALRAELLPLALGHSNPEVRLEGAWADVRAKGTQGLPVLQEACLEPNFSALAIRYLGELEMQKSIPAAALQPDFAAKAGMIDWLKHPNELGQPPATIEVFDSRTLHWPPTKERIPVWLFKYTFRFNDTEPSTTGYGMFGSMTWSFFHKYESPPTPEQLYAKHCAQELSRRPGLKEAEGKVTPEQALELLKKDNPGVFGP